MNYKKYVFYYLFVLLLVIISVFYACSDFKSSASLPNNNEESNSSINNDIIDINYTYIEDSAKKIDKYFDYSRFTNNIYNLTKDYDVKMYKNKLGSVLEIKLDRETAQKYLTNYFKMNDYITLRILFDKNSYDSIDIDKLYYDLNKEKVIRENIVNTALKEVGNTGEKYLNWYGFNHRVEWCAVFVSWVANQNGLLNTKVPKFVWVKIGVDYYKEKSLLKFPNKYSPKKGDLIFFDWNNNGVIDHVGIVEKTDKKYVYTIEGNVNHLNVQNKKYPLKSPYIYAYGELDFSDLD